LHHSWSLGLCYLVIWEVVKLSIISGRGVVGGSGRFVSNGKVENSHFSDPLQRPQFDLADKPTCPTLAYKSFSALKDYKRFSKMIELMTACPARLLVCGDTVPISKVRV
jgi:hypothetical protein